MKMKRGLLKIYYLIYYISSVHIILRDKPAGAQDDCIVFIRLLFFLLLLIVCTPFSFHLPFFFFLQENAVMPCVLLSPNRPTLSFYFLISPIPFTVFFFPITIPAPLSQLLGERKNYVYVIFVNHLYIHLSCILYQERTSLTFTLGGPAKKKLGLFF